MKTAMILAAGRGERLKLLTHLVPKAMCLIKGRPLIEYHVVKLAKAGVKRIVINHAHLGGQIRQFLKEGNQYGVEICYAPEPPGGLETGGGIFNALPLLGNDPFMTVNADIYTDFDFASFLFPNSDSLVHLVLGKNPHHNSKGDFGLNDNNQLCNEATFTFLGIAYYHPEVFKEQYPGRYSVTPIIRNLTAQHRASGEVYQGLWIDIGTPERLSYANTLPPHAATC